MALVTRDPFARAELHRTRVYHIGAQTCAWCGQVRNTRPADPTNGRQYLYRFRIETDGGTTREEKHLFCSRDCRTSYHG